MTLVNTLEGQAERGDGQACLDLYETCRQKTEETNADYWLDKALDANYPSAQYVEGIRRLQQGWHAEGLAYLEAASFNGNVKASYVLAQYYLGNIRSVSPAKVDFQRGLEYLREAALAGDARSQILLGKIFWSGKWTDKNDWLARWWLEKACEQNSGQGQMLKDGSLLVRNVLN